VPGHTMLHQCRMKIDHMGHDRRPQHSYCDIDAAAGEFGDHNVPGDSAPIWVCQENFDGIASSDAKHKQHDYLFQTAEPITFRWQDEENSSPGKQRRHQHVYVEDEVKAPRGAE